MKQYDVINRLNLMLASSRTCAIDVEGWVLQWSPERREWYAVQMYKSHPRTWEATSLAIVRPADDASRTHLLNNPCIACLDEDWFIVGKDTTGKLEFLWRQTERPLGSSNCPECQGPMVQKKEDQSFDFDTGGPLGELRVHAKDIQVWQCLDCGLRSSGVAASARRGDAVLRAVLDEVKRRLVV